MGSWVGHCLGSGTAAPGTLWNTVSPCPWVGDILQGHLFLVLCLHAGAEPAWD